MEKMYEVSFTMKYHKACVDWIIGVPAENADNAKVYARAFWEGYCDSVAFNPVPHMFHVKARATGKPVSNSYIVYPNGGNNHGL